MIDSNILPIKQQFVPFVSFAMDWSLITHSQKGKPREKLFFLCSHKYQNARTTAQGIVRCTGHMGLYKTVLSDPHEMQIFQMINIIVSKIYNIDNLASFIGLR